ncbi:MAG TPA: NAD-dependent epimerase/dehydratase family protein [Chryseolinea sp.]|nr:NAD-dependent epimerase/dehydratase family protein [Chryseolinea sp.]
MDEQAVKKPKLVVAGASGFIGTAVCKELVKHHDVVVLTRSRARSQMANPSIPITWLYCDLFSRHDVENALAGAEYVVYLVHVRIPTARLDQSRSDDVNLLLADNFAQAAQINNVRQIVFFGGMISEENMSFKILESDNEVLRTLSSYNVPVTSIRAGLVAGPGGIFIRLLANMTLRFPIVFVPRWALKPRQPISVKDVARAINYCIGNPETFGKQFDIGGPDIMPFDEMMKMTASSLSKKRIIITTNFFTPRLYALWIRLLCRGTNQNVINLFVESLRLNMLVSENPLQHFIMKDAESYFTTFTACIDKTTNRFLPNPRINTSNKDHTDLRFESRVRSIQRFTLKENGHAAWLAETFFRWLTEFAKPFISVNMDSDGSCSFYTRFPKFKLLTLTFKPEHSSLHRRMYFITDGVLLRPMIERKARLEFRDVLNGRFNIGAIHDYTPRIPWYFYISTQALVHSFVMRAFQKHLEKTS